MKRPVGGDEASTAVAAITRWRSNRDAEDFPYGEVVAAFHRVGKHLVATELLEALAGVRAALPEVRGPASSVQVLDRFLDAALDKWDDRYANPTYLGLSLLPLASVDDDGSDVGAVEARYDRLLVALIADTMRFEIAAAAGETGFLPEMRAEARTTAKRCRLGLQVVGPAARRLGLDDGLTGTEPLADARRLGTNVAADLSLAERRLLQLTMLPVSTIHDEYQFIRILQSFEATFAMIAVQLSAAIEALADGGAGLAIRHLRAAEAVLHEAAPLFSLVATMQVESFQAFRVFTEGASAIQSRNYKLVESLCRQPDPDRLDSVAYLSVPEVRQRVLAGQMSLDDALAAAHAAGRLSPDDSDGLEREMRRFAATLLRWRRAHYRIAVRMLGERTGTGYTEGALYLKAAQAIPVFRSVTVDDDTEARDATDAAGGTDQSIAAPTGDVSGERGRCPFAAGARPRARSAAAP